MKHYILKPTYLIIWYKILRSLGFMFNKPIVIYIFLSYFFLEYHL